MLTPRDVLDAFDSLATRSAHKHAMVARLAERTRESPEKVWRAIDQVSRQAH
jgi:hypothetical protein